MDFQYLIFAIYLFYTFETIVAPTTEEECLLRSSQITPVGSCSDETLESFKPWPLDNECGAYDVEVSKMGTWTPTALVGFYSSGLSWFLDIIQESSGFATGMVGLPLTETPLISQGRIQCSLAPWDGKAIVQGTHEDKEGRFYPYWFRKRLTKLYEQRSSELGSIGSPQKVIILIRNPWHALLNAKSEIRAQTRGCGCGCCAEEGPPRSLNVYSRFLEKGGEEWIHTNKEWLTNDSSATLVVQYEKMLAKPEEELRRILRFLNVTIDEGRLKCVLKESPAYKSVIRSKDNMAEIRSFFESSRASKKQIKIIEKGIKEINGLIKAKSLGEPLSYKSPVGHKGLSLLTLKALKTRRPREI